MKTWLQPLPVRYCSAPSLKPYPTLFSPRVEECHSPLLTADPGHYRVTGPNGHRHHQLSEVCADKEPLSRPLPVLSPPPLSSSAPSVFAIHLDHTFNATGKELGYLLSAQGACGKTNAWPWGSQGI